jgi:hypothetical protein
MTTLPKILNITPKNVVEEIVAKTNTATDFPEISRVVPEISDQNIRKLIV